jgi:hypothetical protein
MYTKFISEYLSVNFRAITDAFVDLILIKTSEIFWGWVNANCPLYFINSFHLIGASFVLQIFQSQAILVENGEFYTMKISFSI